MIDNELIKALKCLASQDSTGQCYADYAKMSRIHTDKPLVVCNPNLADGELCSFHQDKYGVCFEDGECAEWLPKVVDVITCQQAEIERLEKENAILSRNADTAFQDGLNENQALFEKTIIKEFARTLKNSIIINNLVSGDTRDVLIAEIDELTREMAGDKNVQFNL